MGGGSQRTRDHAVDRARTVFLFSMLAAHFTLANGGVSLVDEALRLPAVVTGADGFVVAAGVSVGLLWERRGSSRGFAAWALGRAGYLFVWHMVLALVGLAFVRHLHRPAWFPAVDADAAGLVQGRWAMPFADILWMYAIFLAVTAGLVLVRATPTAIVVGTGVVYASQQVAGWDVGLRSNPNGPLIWDVLAWQSYYFMGLAAGRRWTAVRGWFERHDRLVRWGGAATVVTLIGIRGAFNLAEIDVLPVELLDRRPAWESLFAKRAMPPARIAVALIVVAWVYRSVAHPALALLTPPGQASLRLYVAHVPVLMVVTLLPDDPSVWSATVVTFVALVVTTAVAWTQRIGRGRWWSI